MNDSDLKDLFFVLWQLALLILMILLVTSVASAESITIGSNVTLSVQNESVSLFLPGQTFSTTCGGTLTQVFPVTSSFEYAPVTVVVNNSFTNYSMILQPVFIVNQTNQTTILNCTMPDSINYTINASATVQCDYDNLTSLLNTSLMAHDEKIRGVLIDKLSAFNCPNLNFSIQDVPASERQQFQEKLDNCSASVLYYSNRVSVAESGQKLAEDRLKPWQDRINSLEADRNTLGTIVLLLVLVLVLQILVTQGNAGMPVVKRILGLSPGSKEA